MKVQSTPNQGSRFVVQLPFHPVGVAGKRTDVATNPEGKDPGEVRQDIGNGKADAITVMIVDDHAVMRQGLAALLHNQPEITVVAEASDGQQAVDFALQYRPAVVLMDYSMPLLNGADATRKIKREVPEIVVIGLSMYGDPGTRKEMMAAGARYFLQKDVQSAELIQAIKRCAN
jgi:CheY-like chemotaxis protein